ncbi:MAG: WD40/YVTN/BNR-like repeat-containing protein [Candidatus Entotheonellia bacterium]
MPQLSKGVLLGAIALALILAGVGWGIAGEIQGIGAPMDHTHAMAYDHGRNMLFLGTHQGLSRSQDEGKTWSKVDVKGDVPSTDFMVLAIDPMNPQTLYAAGHGLWVIKSIDGGTTWALKQQGLDGDDVHALAMDPNDPQKLHAWVVDKGLYRSTNGGDVWARVDDGPKVPVTQAPTDVKGLLSVNIPTGMGGIYLAAATASGFFISADCF